MQPKQYCFQVFLGTLKASCKLQKGIMMKVLLSGGQTLLKFLFSTAADLSLQTAESVLFSLH